MLLLVLFQVADAPPHGVGYPGDRFPGGSPLGSDWRAMTDVCVTDRILVFTVGCEPNALAKGGASSTAPSAKEVSAKTWRGPYLGGEATA